MPRGVLIESVKPNSPARHVGVRSGDRLLAINGREVEDHLDVRFHAATGDLVLELDRRAGTVSLFLPEHPHPLRGIAFEEIRPRLCACECIFCFIDQLPPGVRPSLKVKDEDYRLSFLHGNYVTLNTLKERDIARILEQRLSPLYVSVHAVDDEVRATILGRPPRRPLLPTMKRLIDGGIELYGQIVLCPDLNDGAILDETVTVLSRLHPGLRGVAVVPLGLSDHRPPDPLLKPVTRRLARDLLERLHPHQERLLSELGTRFVFPGDEFFLKAGLPLPPSHYYEEYDQMEDGIGMARFFVDAFEREWGRIGNRPPALDRLAVVTGMLFGPTLQGLLNRLVERFPVDLKLIPVQNDYLGHAINVAGLLSGRDVARALEAEAGGYPAAIPSEMVSRANGLLLDDYSPEQVAREGKVARLHIARGADGLLKLLWGGNGESEGTNS